MSLKLASKAKDQDGSGQNRVVTKSNKACALLIFENYIDEWKLQLQEPVPVNDANHADGTNDANDANDGRPKKIQGKYSVKSSGHSKYGG